MESDDALFPKASASRPGLIGAFGEEIPRGIGRRQNQAFGRPLARGFGFLPEKKRAKFEASLAENLEAGSPLAQFISGVRGFSGDVLPKAQEIGANIATRAPAQFNRLQGQIDTLLSQLPGFQRQAESTFGQARGAATGALGQLSELQGQLQPGLEAAQGFLSDVSAPGRSGALFQQFAQPGLDVLRQSQAARGIAGQGAGLGGEQDFIQNLTRQFISDQAGLQQNALTGLGSIIGRGGELSGTQGAIGQVLGGLAEQQAGTQQALGGLGIDAAGAGLNSLNTLSSLLQQEFNIPMTAANNMMALLQGSQNPALTLLQMMLPNVGQVSSSGIAGIHG